MLQSIKNAYSQACRPNELGQAGDAFPDHRQFLRFAFKGNAYEYLVLPFRRSLAPCTFLKCAEAELAALQRGVSVFMLWHMLVGWFGLGCPPHFWVGSHLLQLAALDPTGSSRFGYLMISSVICSSPESLPPLHGYLARGLES